MNENLLNWVQTSLNSITVDELSSIQDHGTLLLEQYKLQCIKCTRLWCINTKLLIFA